MVSVDADGAPRGLVGARLREARKIIEREYATPLTLQRLARRVRLPRFAFQQAYEDAYGAPPLHHLREVRAREAARLLADGRSAHDAALMVGYAQERTFCTDFRRAFRDDPGRLRLLEHARGES